MNKNFFVLNDFNQKELGIRIIGESGKILRDYFVQSVDRYLEIDLIGLLPGDYCIQLFSSEKQRVHKITLLP